MPMFNLRLAIAPLILSGLAACDALDPPPPQTQKMPSAETKAPVVTDRPLGLDEIRTPAGIRVLPAAGNFNFRAGARGTRNDARAVRSLGWNQ